MSSARLRLRRLTEEDAAFILELFTDPAFVENVGDRGIRTLGDAGEYIRTGPRASYERHGFGLQRVELAATGVAIGICGLLKRDYLPHPDLGFAFLPAHRSRGYATESAAAVVDDARESLGLTRLLAITRPGNDASEKVLGKLGFTLEGKARPVEGEPEVHLFALEMDQAGGPATAPRAL